jgi:3-phosphoshikimate 1-carboxyvinyltransferase
VASIPTRGSGKVDRDALPWPLERPDEESAPAVGLTATGEWVAERWTAALGVAVAGPRDDFFASGGGSLVAAQLVPDSSVSTRRTGLNPTRSGILEMIRLFGGRMGITPTGDSLGEPFGEVSSRGSVLRGIRVSGELALRGLDEIPIACALAAKARGVTEISDVAELREDAPDKLRELAQLLRAFGISVEEKPDGLLVEGRPDRPLTAARVSSGGDHRLAMTAAVLALAADGECVVDDADAIAVSFPRFVGTLRALGADIEVQQ